MSKSKADKLYDRMIAWPSDKLIKRYVNVTCKAQGKHATPKILRNYKKKLQKSTWLRYWFKEPRYAPKRYSIEYLLGMPEPLTGSEAWKLYHQVRKHYLLRSVLLHAGDDSYAGNEIPTVADYYRMYGRVVVLTTMPDWDNYHTDFIIEIDGELVARYEG